MNYGTVTFMLEAEDESKVQDAIERIQSTVETHCPDLTLNVSEDIWDDNETA